MWPQILKKERKSFGYAFEGIKSAFETEFHLKIHVSLLVLVIVFGFLLQISLTEWMVCIICFGMVIGAELLNTAVEAVVDLVSPDEHPLAKKAKDVAAGAVLVAAISAAISGMIIFLPKLWLIFCSV